MDHPVYWDWDLGSVNTLYIETEPGSVVNLYTVTRIWSQCMLGLRFGFSGHAEYRNWKGSVVTVYTVTGRVTL